MAEWSWSFALRHSSGVREPGACDMIWKETWPASMEERRNVDRSLSFWDRPGMCLNCSEYWVCMVAEEEAAVEKKCSSRVIKGGSMVVDFCRGMFVECWGIAK